MDDRELAAQLARMAATIDKLNGRVEALEKARKKDEQEARRISSQMRRL